MPECEQSRLWVLVTDGHRAHIVMPDTVQGRFRTRLPLGIAEPPHYPPALPREIPVGPLKHFAADVADRLDQSAAEDAFDDLVLAGPARVIAEIRAVLGADAFARLIGLQTWEGAVLDNDGALSAFIARWWWPPPGTSDATGLRPADAGEVT